MRTTSSWLTLIVPLLLSASTLAQFANWIDGQVNTTICYWSQPRAALIRDTVYLDGGNIWWSPGLETGEIGTVANDGNLQGVVLSFNLSEPFSSDTNTTSILVKNKLYKGQGGSDSSASVPSYLDGAMLANNASFFLYGGVPLLADYLYDLPGEGNVDSYERYVYGLDKPLFHAGFKDVNTDNDVSTFIAYGGGVNVPSENKAFYFSGMQAPSGGPIYVNPPNATSNATSTAASLITLDFGVQYQESWKNQSLPTNITGRANPEVVWVPVGEEGLLVVLGGVTHPQWIDTSGAHESSDPDASKKQSPEFMRTIDLYDIANKKWYQQPTKNSPGTRTRGCAVVATAKDKSSYNIYYYGGFDGLDINGEFHDDVWVLSLPSFTWTRLNEGTALHGRAGHKCFMPYPDQMMVFGGYTPSVGSTPTCLDGGPVVNFNLSSGKWLEGYDPTEWSEYAVPTKVQSAIGGHGEGGATATAPVPSGWSTSGLAGVFKTSYDDKKMEKFYPYAEASSTSRPDLPGDDDDDDDKGGGGVPSWVGPVLGTVLGVAVLIGLLVLFLLYRSRRSIFKNRSTRQPGSEDYAGLRILSWIKGQPAAKSGTITSTVETPLSPEMAGVAPTITANTSSAAPNASVSSHAELANNYVAELEAPFSPTELHDRSLSPQEVIKKHSKFGNDAVQSGSMSSPSYHSSFSPANADYSSVSHSQEESDGLDSPTLEHTQMRSGDRGVSMLSSPQSTVLGSPLSGLGASTMDSSMGNRLNTTARQSVFREEDDDGDMGRT